jgi:hypothetical protein
MSTHEPRWDRHDGDVLAVGSRDNSVIECNSVGSLSVAACSTRCSTL